jgi:hypothetical protein
LPARLSGCSSCASLLAQGCAARTRRVKVKLSLLLRQTEPAAQRASDATRTAVRAARTRIQTSAKLAEGLCKICYSDGRKCASRARMSGTTGGPHDWHPLYTLVAMSVREPLCTVPAGCNLDQAGARGAAVTAWTWSRSRVSWPQRSPMASRTRCLPRPCRRCSPPQRMSGMLTPDSDAADHHHRACAFSNWW